MAVRPWCDRAAVPLLTAVLSAIAVAGMTSERKFQSSSRNASPSTNANTYGTRELSWWLKSTDFAVPAHICRGDCADRLGHERAAKRLKRMLGGLLADYGLCWEEVVDRAEGVIAQAFRGDV